MLQTSSTRRLGVQPVSVQHDSVTHLLHERNTSLLQNLSASIQNWLQCACDENQCRLNKVRMTNILLITWRPHDVWEDHYVCPITVSVSFVSSSWVMGCTPENSEVTLGFGVTRKRPFRWRWIITHLFLCAAFQMAQSKHHPCQQQQQRKCHLGIKWKKRLTNMWSKTRTVQEQLTKFYCQGPTTVTKSMKNDDADMQHLHNRRNRQTTNGAHQVLMTSRTQVM